MRIIISPFQFEKEKILLFAFENVFPMVHGSQLSEKKKPKIPQSIFPTHISSLREFQQLVILLCAKKMISGVSASVNL